MSFDWAPYVPVAERKAKAKREMEKMRKNGKDIQPIQVSGRKIANTFWGESWCKHLEKFSTYENRLPRGRTYIRNGSVCHLEIKPGRIEAIVSGSSLYRVNIDIKPLAEEQWKEIRQKCSGQISSILELLQGKLSNAVMEVVSDTENGLFPQPKEISLACSCPDWAAMCKHIAAVLYGVGAKLDHQPELLFLLRKVDHQELMSSDLQFVTETKGERRRPIGEVADIFGIEMEIAPEAPQKTAAPKAKKETTQKSKPIKKVTLLKKNPKMIKLLPVKKLKKTTPKKNPKIISITSIRASATPIKSSTKSKKTEIRVSQIMAPITGQMLIDLRKKFEMNKSQFARLIEASPVLVTSWEKKTSVLKLQEEVEANVNLLRNSSKAQAWNILEKLS